ncbi:Uu.00g014330.m01.CDS01 [Anthostomella pinea]|uniref:Uu.00g014330.m01.CDS01 n=1 Tax=Anthostomella pinea TaxID=933095 RepID=A0AAI8VYA6_9PEZI|nr:Uu.00g014330.m01.CDS01 [Anthostomella pinea]
MAPVRPRKRKSDQSPTTSPQRSPIKKRNMGISITQKQALIDNLQLEITERARRLRAQYHIQAQQLRSRVEMRVNRIPTALRKAKMGDLLAKTLKPQQSRAAKPKSPYVARPPPVPAKDGTSPKPTARKPVPTSSTTRGHKRLSNEMASDDKENQGEHVDIPKKRLRGAPAKETVPIAPSQILSPTSSNTRVLPRERPASPTKSMIGRPASPVKGLPKKASSNLLSSMVERARATRPPAVTRNTTTSTTSSSAAPAPTASTRTRKAAMRPPSAAATRGRRKLSATSESSEVSTATVVKKTTASRAAKTAPATKRTMMSTIKSATTKKAPVAKQAAAPATTGRTLRSKRA